MWRLPHPPTAISNVQILKRYGNEGWQPPKCLSGFDGVCRTKDEMHINCGCAWSACESISIPMWTSPFIEFWKLVPIHGQKWVSKMGSGLARPCAVFVIFRLQEGRGEKGGASEKVKQFLHCSKCAPFPPSKDTTKEYEQFWSLEIVNINRGRALQDKLIIFIRSGCLGKVEAVLGLSFSLYKEKSQVPFLFAGKKGRNYPAQHSLLSTICTLTPHNCLHAASPISLTPDKQKKTNWNELSCKISHWATVE